MRQRGIEVNSTETEEVVQLAVAVLMLHVASTSSAFVVLFVAMKETGTQTQEPRSQGASCTYCSSKMIVQPVRPSRVARRTMQLLQICRPALQTQFAKPSKPSGFEGLFLEQME